MGRSLVWSSLHAHGKGRRMTETIFLLDANLGLPVDEMPWSSLLSAAGIRAVSTTDLVHLDVAVARHEPDISYLPIAGFHRIVASGDNHYRGLAIATSKFTGTTHLPSVLVVRKDDPAANLDDLARGTLARATLRPRRSFRSPLLRRRPPPELRHPRRYPAAPCRSRPSSTTTRSTRRSSFRLPTTCSGSREVWQRQSTGATPRSGKSSSPIRVRAWRGRSPSTNGFARTLPWTRRSRT
jgi:hypothetical protein